MSLYFTTPIFYVNAQPHLGHSFTAIIADTICRYNRLAGRDVFFQTGTDEHGDKIVQAAGDSGVTPQIYADTISNLFRETWPLLAIEPDRFIRTTEPDHISTVQSILQKVYDQGDIYFSEYSGLYCVGCERFLTEKELVDGKCPDHLAPPSLIREQNYFFRMSKYQDWLIDHIQANPDFIRPERYRNEVLSFLKDPLEDLCISRPTSRLTWGIPLPFDNRFVTYVWFDALINYLTGIGYPNDDTFPLYWKGAEHIIAKDILKPHAIYWPTMLKAIGLEPYNKLHVHGFWLVDETKMSKSLGNVVRPGAMVEEYGVDTFRYFLLREMSFGLDASFTTAGIERRRNSDLANDLGNLFSRSLTMVKKFAADAVPQPGPPTAVDQELADAAVAMLAAYRQHMEDFAFSRALMDVWEVISLANKYIVTNPPWELAKDPAQQERLRTVLYTLLETLRFISLTLYPVMPETAARIATALGLGKELPDLDRMGTWGLLVPGTGVALLPPLFPRLEKTSTAAPPQQPGKTPPIMENKSADKQESADQLIAFEDFQKLDIRVGEIIAAEKIKKADRLLKLTVKTPEERTVVAGIAEHYQPEKLVGKKVLVVVNLKPTKLKGILSEGMILAAKDGGRLTLTTVMPFANEEIIPAGSKVS